MKTNHHPAEEAWEKFAASTTSIDDSDQAALSAAQAAFSAGWNASLAWLPLRIEQFREIEQELKNENEKLRNALRTYADEDNWTSTNGEWANLFNDGSAMDGYGIAKAAIADPT